jgi:uroporphyrinogen III methyltransferase/synthase
MKTPSGRVYLIGAGPGDPGLITVKGKEILQKCDVVIYDALVNEILIATLPERIKRIFVGKRGGETSTPQATINNMLVNEAKKGKNVARLKGGDPLLFGRGSEEMEYLKEHDISYDVVPGISSALAAPAWAGIPVTHRSDSRSVAIVTGHLKAGDEIDKLELPVADTIVFLMAMQNLPYLVGKLLSEDRFTKKTPAAIVRNGTLPDQQVVLGTLETIAELKERNKIKAPAVLVVGKTASFAKSLKWFKTPPLAGIRAVLLRTPEQSDELMMALFDKGATVVPWPIIKIEPRTTVFDRVNAEYLKPFTSVIFTSPNGVRIFMDALLQRSIDSRHLHGKKIFALGAGTATTLVKYGIIVDGVPDKFVAEGVLGLFPKKLNGEKILIPRASKAREVLPDSLKERGAAVTVLPVYDTVKSTITHCPVENGDYVLFTSSSTAEFFYNDKRCKEKTIIPCCMGEITATTVRKYYNGDVFVAKNATIPALVDVLAKAVKKKTPVSDRRKK